MCHDDVDEHEHHPGPLPGDVQILRSVGIDIGSTTMHLVFSELEAARHGGVYRMEDRRTTYQSAVHFTPYTDNGLIDETKVSEFVDGEYLKAGVRPQDLDTGVVILTGVALARANSLRIARVASGWGSQFVSVAAGDHLEARIAAHGSGAVALSKMGRQRTLNMDIGGGTTKLALCEDGSVRNWAALDIGGRLLAWDTHSRVLHTVEPAGRRIAEILGFDAKVGERFPAESETMVGERLATALHAVATGIDDPLLRQLARGEWPVFERPDRLVLSGGVSEYLRGERTPTAGDLGQAIAASIARWERANGPEVRVSEWGIRSTVIGAGQHVSQLSGLTIHRSSTLRLPIANAPVVVLEDFMIPDENPDEATVASVVRTAVGRSSYVRGEGGTVALFLRWQGSATLPRLAALARGLSSGLESVASSGTTVIVVCDQDVARLVGEHLQAALGDTRPLLVLDGLELSEFDYVDVGVPLSGSVAVPVVIKSLAFPEARSSGEVQSSDEIVDSRSPVDRKGDPDSLGR